MEEFKSYIDKIEDPKQREIVTNVLEWISDNYPTLEKRLAWNSPVFTDHGTFIISLEGYKKHLAITPEGAGIREFQKELDEKGLKYGKMNINFPWNVEIDYNLLKRIIDFNIKDKKDTETFWRK